MSFDHLIGSFDHLIGKRDQRGWYGEAEGLGDLEVGYEIKFGGMHDRQVGWLFAFEDTVFIFPPRIQ